jgi:hypothetical protein
MQAMVLLAPVRELLPKLSKGLLSRFVLSAGGILLLAGTVKVLDFFAKPQVPDMQDPIFAVSFRHLVLLVGMMELIVAFFCLFTNKKTLSLCLLAWLVVTLATYRIGLWMMGWHHPYAWVAGWINALDISPRVADLIICTTSAYLLVGSIAILWLERRAVEAANFLKMSCPACGVHIKFAVQNVGKMISCPHCQKEITLRETENLKMSCVLCGGHIEFPSTVVGQKIPCPHCAKTITLFMRDSF